MRCWMMNGCYYGTFRIRYPHISARYGFSQSWRKLQGISDLMNTPNGRLSTMNHVVTGPSSIGIFWGWNGRMEGCWFLFVNLFSTEVRNNRCWTSVGGGNVLRHHAQCGVVDINDHQWTTWQNTFFANNLQIGWSVPTFVIHRGIRL